MMTILFLCFLSLLLGETDLFFDFISVEMDIIMLG